MSEWQYWLGAVAAIGVTLAGLDFRAVRRARRRPLMERVAEYVNQCDSLGWRAVFTTEQFRVIWRHWIEVSKIDWPGPLPEIGRTVTLLGILVTIDDTPRPPMPSPSYWATVAPWLEP